MCEGHTNAQGGTVTKHKCSCLLGPTSSPAPPSFTGPVNESLLKGAGMGKGALWSPSFPQHQPGRPRALRPGWLWQCRREGALHHRQILPLPKEAKVAPSPAHSTQRLVQMPAGIGVPKAAIANVPTIPAASGTRLEQNWL